MNSFIDYIKLPYWIFNAEKYIDNVLATNQALYEKIYDKVYCFDLYANGPLIIFVIVISPIILVLIKRVKLLDYFCFFIIMCLNCCCLCHVYNQISARWDIKGIGYLISWIHVAIAILGMFVFTLVAWALSAKKLKE